MPDDPTSSYFNSGREKLVLRSKDGTLFRVSQLKLSAASTVFGDILGIETGAREGEVVQLEEKRAVLEPFLRFVLWKDVPSCESFESIIQILEVCRKYDVQVGATALCEQLFPRFAKSRTLEVWAVCARAGQDGLARACLHHLSDGLYCNGRYKVNDGQNGVILAHSRPFSPSDLSLTQLEGIPAKSLRHLLLCYDQVVLYGKSWSAAVLSLEN